MSNPGLLPVLYDNINITAEKGKKMAKLFQRKTSEFSMLDHGNLRLRNTQDCRSLSLREMTFFDYFVYFHCKVAFYQQFFRVR
jgi:hypothetical protein